MYCRLKLFFHMISAGSFIKQFRYKLHRIYKVNCLTELKYLSAKMQENKEFYLNGSEHFL